MDKNTTRSKVSLLVNRDGQQRPKMVPSEKTLTFLKAFARNYRAEMTLPEGLQGVILG